ncbi:MAG: tail fiber domain-containing protein, partial [Bacteroidota bacterium]
RRMVLEEDGGMRLYESNGNSYLLDVGNGNMQFIGDGGDVAMSIDDANGNIRIGSGSPNSSRKLEVRGDGSVERVIFAENNSGGSGLSSRIAIFGIASSSTTGTNVGVWGQAFNGTNSYAGYFAGDLLYTEDLINGSDQKFKQHIQDFDALEQVLELRPRTYKMKQKAFPQMNFSDGLKYGFIAQELQNTFPTLVSKNPMPSIDSKHKALSNDSFLGVDYIKLIPILTRAIQEQHSIIEEKEDQIEQLHERVAKLEQMFEQLVSQQSIELEKPSDKFCLKQNQPNPFSTTTTIKYSIPETANESKIIFTNLNGLVIKTVAVNGTGQLEITTPDLPAGTYTYSLVIDGKIIATNKMILTK